MEKWKELLQKVKNWINSNPQKFRYVCIGIVLATVACIVIVLLSTREEDRHETLVWQGDASLIEKTQEQKEMLVIGTIEAIEGAQTYYRDNQPSDITNDLVYEPLFRVTEDLSIENVLAKSVEFSKDGLEARVTLQKAVFSDGSPVTAEDVKKAYLNILKNNEDGKLIDRCCNIQGINEYMVQAAEDITGITVESDNRLVFTFAKVAAWNIQAFTLPVYKESGTEDAALGSGPYKIGSYRHNESIQLVKNRENKKSDWDYESIIIKRISTLGLAEKIEGYELDIFILPYSYDLELIKEAGYYNIYRLLDNENLSYFFINPESEGGSNKLLREAITKSIDRKQLSKELGDEEAVNNGYLTATSDTVEGLVRDVNVAEEILENVIEPEVFFYGATDAVSQLRFDALKEDLKEAGISVKRGSEEEHTMRLELSGEGSILKEVEESILQSEQKDSYEKAVLQIYQKDTASWLQEMEQYYMEECFIIPYSTNLYHLIISSDVDAEAIRKLM